MGVMQHHDAITGTEHDDVKQDYHRLLAQGIETATSEAAKAFSAILGMSTDLNFTSCPQLNVSVCGIAIEDEFNIVVYNPLARVTSYYIHIPATGYYYEVEGPTGEVVESHLTSLIDYFTEVPDKLGSTLIFKAENLPALGYQVYKIKHTVKKEKMKNATRFVEQVDQMGFQDNYVNFDLSTGYLKSITLSGVTLEVSQQFLYYNSSDVSNAYIFRPDGNNRNATEITLVTNSVLINDGNLVREVKQSFRGGINQIIRIYKDEDFIEFDWLIGYQDTSLGGKEIITRYITNLETQDEFYTDSNGREMITRKRNYRPTYEYSDEEPQSGNYYPVNTRIVIKNETNEFAVLTDRSEGGSSLTSGQVELMVTRQIPNSLDEHEYGSPVKVRGTHYVTHGVSAEGNGGRTMAAVERNIVQRKLIQPWLFFTTDDISVKQHSFLNKELQPNVHLLTLDSWGDGTVLIRLEHVFEKDDDPELSKEVTVDLTGLFKPFNIHTMKEYTLAANIPLEESDRLSWAQLKSEDPSSPLSKAQRLTRDEEDLVITLEPMQIRTFIATVSPVES
uniref:Lysosomal alpha-mannosidase n=1 Tax=Anoplophora glabripennis TaxID=217634 RepID=V5G1A0_ANOGL